jgi:hypothetical protein
VSAAGRLGRSDHEQILMELTAGKQSKIEPEIRLNWKKCNFGGMREFLYYHSWDLNGTVEQDWSEFKNIMARLVSEFVPVQRMVSKQRPKWLTADLKG